MNRSSRTCLPSTSLVARNLKNPREMPLHPQEMPDVPDPQP